MKPFVHIALQVIWLLRLTSAVSALGAFSQNVKGSSVLPHYASLRGQQHQDTILNSEQTSSEEQKVKYDPLYFGLMIDAGSSGTRVRMFRWTLQRKVDLREVVPLEGDEDLFEVRPGLSAYLDNPEEALPPLAGMLKAAQRYVPKAVWEDSLLFLKATAGMRLADRKKASRVMSTVKDFLSNPDKCPFKFVSAEIISGEEEAVFSFITANYNLGTLSSPDRTVGTLEMGGASQQVVFRPSEGIQEHEFQFYLAGERQSVYARSYLRFGADAALARTLTILVQQNRSKLEVQSPCHNPGFKGNLSLSNGDSRFFIGTGNSTACAEVVRKMMGLDIECLLAPCALWGSYVAPIHGDFFATAAHFYTANGLGLVGWKDSKTLAAEDLAEATEVYCSKDLNTAQKDSGKPMKYAQNYCFMGTYVQQSLLVHGFTRESKSSVVFSRKIDGFNLGWPAGAMLFETQMMPLSLKPREGVRDLCSTPAKFVKPSDAKSHARALGSLVSPLGLVAAATFFI